MAVLPPKPPIKGPVVPPSARPLPKGVTGTAPLPTGRVVSARPASSLTDNERKTLTAIGWTEDMPIPANMASLVEQIRKEQSNKSVPMPVAPNTPKLATPIVDESSLSPAEQEDVRRRIMDMVTQEQQAAEAQAEEARLAAANARTPGVAQAMSAANQAARVSEEPVAEVTLPLSAPTAVESQTGATQVPSHCQHCGWPVGAEDVPEPPYSERLAFLQAVLGNKPYIQERSLLGGNLKVQFRTLTGKEIDVIYRQAYLDKQAGKIATELDYHETLNRYRLFLQLCRFDPTNGTLFEAPQGYSPDTNDTAKTHWTEESVAAAGDGDTRLADVESHILDNVLKTEAIFRIVHSDCNQFNRMVAKMEAMADNSDFWQQTAAPSS